MMMMCCAPICVCIQFIEKTLLSRITFPSLEIHYISLPEPFFKTSKHSFYARFQKALNSTQTFCIFKLKLLQSIDRPGPIMKFSRRSILAFSLSLLFSALTIKNAIAITLPEPPSLAVENDLPSSTRYASRDPRRGGEGGVY